MPTSTHWRSRSAHQSVMEADCDAPTVGEYRRERKAKVEAALARCELHYVKGGFVAGALGPASKTLNDLIRGRSIDALEDEFTRALRNVEANPREAVSAGSNILESVCKIYIQDRGLEMPAKQDLPGVWAVGSERTLGLIQAPSKIARSEGDPKWPAGNRKRHRRAAYAR